MNSGEGLQGHATNAFDSAGIVFRDCLETAGMTAMYAGLLEAPVAAIENYLHYRRGRMTGEEAVKEAAMAIGKRAGTGAVVGFTVTGAVVLLGAGPLVVTIAPVFIARGYGVVRLYCAKTGYERCVPPPVAAASRLASGPGRHVLLQPAMSYEIRLRDRSLCATAVGGEPCHSRSLIPSKSTKEVNHA